MPRKGLTPKQSVFVREYLVDLNATAAAIRAGYSKRVAPVQGYENLQKPAIQAAIQAAMEERSKRTEITADRVLAEYAKIAFLDPRKLFDKDGELIPIHELDDETAGAIGGIDQEAIYACSGEDRHQTGVLKKIKLNGKQGALDSLAKHLGLLTEKIDVTSGGLPLSKFDDALEKAYGADDET